MVVLGRAHRPPKTTMDLTCHRLETIGQGRPAKRWRDNLDKYWRDTIWMRTANTDCLIDDVSSRLFWLATLTCALSASPHFLCSDWPQSVVCLESSSVFYSYLLPAFWVRYVAMYSGGSGCFPLLLPRCRNPCILRPVLRDDT